ncbi:signal peptidase I [Anaerolentibacter hominis]|uniref:signal peptidase I n=1 Tax=Anaerolentibacter hominis TaxID=3079009 RepID=UPI0031B81ED8
MDPRINLYDEPTRGGRILKEVIIYLICAAAAVLLAFLAVRFCLVKISVSGHSMENTLMQGDEIIVNKVSYFISKPKQGDVIVFRQGQAEHNYYNIKRVIGVPGDTVVIQDGLVYVNGDPYVEEIPAEELNTPGLAGVPVILEDNEYFVLGDNRNNSEDSRFANVGLVLKSEIVGKAWIRVKPEFDFVSKLNLLKD